MFKEVTIARADGSGAPTALMANAATALRFKQIFKKDLLTLFANAKTEENGKEVYNIDFLPELTFTMAMQARAKSEGIRIDQLNEDDMIEWLEDYDSMAIENASTEIINVYVGNTQSDSKSKKNRGKRSED